MDNVTYTIIPGAGSAGLTWSAVVDALGATMLPVPNADDVESMAQVLVGDVSDADGPHVLIGASLRAMVALEIAKYQKQIRGSIYGMMSPSKDVPRLVRLWQSGQLHLEELVTRRYALDDINQGYADMKAGLNVRGLVTFP